MTNAILQSKLLPTEALCAERELRFANSAKRPSYGGASCTEEEMSSDGGNGDKRTNISIRYNAVSWTCNGGFCYSQHWSNAAFNNIHQIHRFYTVYPSKYSTSFSAPFIQPYQMLTEGQNIIDVTFYWQFIFSCVAVMLRYRRACERMPRPVYFEEKQ